MNDRVTVVLVGIGGYGDFYLSALLAKGDAEGVEIVGAVDPEPERSRHLADLRRRGTPLHGSIEEFYAASSADLAIIASPIHYHCEQTCAALAHGSHVLCEKPLCATVQEARQMAGARDLAGGFVAVGYQWSFSEAIQAAKRDVGDGAFGRPVRLKTMALWPRDEVYYRRNSWAGLQRDAGGRWVLDSPVNNAVAHYLHNMFYIRTTTRRPCAAGLRGAPRCSFSPRTPWRN